MVSELFVAVVAIVAGVLVVDAKVGVEVLYNVEIGGGVVTLLG